MGPGGPLSSPSRETFTTKGVERLIFARYLLQHPHAGRCPAPCTRWVETVTTPCAWLHRIAAVRAQDKKGVEQVVRRRFRFKFKRPSPEWLYCMLNFLSPERGWATF